MRVVAPVDAVLSEDGRHCRDCGAPRGESHAEGCALGQRPEIRHRYQRRFLGSGPTFTALPSEMEAFRQLPWWRRLGGAERHLRRQTRANSAA